MSNLTETRKERRKLSPPFFFLFYISIFSESGGCGIRDKEKPWNKVVRIIASRPLQRMMIRESELAKRKADLISAEPVFAAAESL